MPLHITSLALPVRRQPAGRAHHPTGVQTAARLGAGTDLRTGIALCLALCMPLPRAMAAAGAGVTPGAALSSAPAAIEGQTPAAGRSCLRCHDPVRHYVGPSFKDIATRYRSDAQAPARLALKIQRGSVGEWGRVIMPRQPQVSADEAAVLARWVLGH